MRLGLPIIVGGLLLGVTTMSAQALDSATVQGHFQSGKQILLTTTELSPKDAADASRTLKLAMSGKFRGVRLNVDGAAPQATELQGALLLSKEESPGGEVVFGAGAEKYWERLTAGDKRIVGAVRYGKEARSFSGSPPGLST